MNITFCISLENLCWSKSAKMPGRAETQARRAGNSIEGVVLQLIHTAALGKLRQLLSVYCRLHTITKFCSVFKTFSTYLSGIHIRSIEGRGRTTAGLPATPWQHEKWGERTSSHAAKRVHRGKTAQRQAWRVRKHFARDMHEILSFCLPISMAWWSLRCTIPARGGGWHLPWICPDWLWKQVSEGTSWQSFLPVLPDIHKLRG